MEICLDITPEVKTRRTARPIVRSFRAESPLRIWHVGASNSPHRVNGVNTSVWLIAESQKTLGHEVHLPLLQEADGGIEGIRTHVVPTFAHRFHSSAIRELVDRHRPDVVHIHSAFIPRHTWLGRLLQDLRVPYVVTPHGALFPEVLERSRLKKVLYTRFLERQFIRSAAAITALTPSELEHIHAYAEGNPPLGRVIFNPIAMHPGSEQWSYRSGRPSIVFLGRFDVVTKGLDRLVEIARLLPNADFNLYGFARDEQGRHLMQTAPENVFFHEPVFGAEKVSVLARATIYLQPSRWEAFSISTSEAMALGVPCAMSENLHLTKILVREKAVLPIPSQPAVAAGKLNALLRDIARLHDLSERGRTFIRTNCAPLSIARQYVAHYRRAIPK